jgi:hypothetical protein
MRRRTTAIVRRSRCSACAVGGTTLATATASLPAGTTGGIRAESDASRRTDTPAGCQHVPVHDAPSRRPWRRGEALFPSRPTLDELWCDYYATAYRGGSTLTKILAIAEISPPSDSSSAHQRATPSPRRRECAGQLGSGGGWTRSPYAILQDAGNLKAFIMSRVDEVSHIADEEFAAIDGTFASNALALSSGGAKRGGGGAEQVLHPRDHQVRAGDQRNHRGERGTDRFRAQFAAGHSWRPEGTPGAASEQPVHPPPAIEAARALRMALPSRW